MDRIDLFRVFVRVVEAGSFTRAADALGLSRPTVSVAIQSLEGRVGARLLNRTTRQVAPTQEGLQFFERCRRVMEDCEETEGLFRGAQSPSGELRVDLPGRVGRLIVAPRLPEFLARNPDLAITLGVTDRWVDLHYLGVDCAMRVGTLPDSTMLARPLGALPVITVASPGYLAARGTPRLPSELKGHHLIRYASPASGRVEPFEWREGDAEHELAMPGRITVNSAEAQIACCLSGLGLAQVPAYDVRAHLAQGELVEVLARFRPAAMPVNLLFPDRHYVPRRAQVFADWVGGLMREQAALMD